MGKHDEISEADKALFRKALEEMNPANITKKHGAQPKPSSPVFPSQAEIFISQDSTHQIGAEKYLEFKRSGVQDVLFKKLKQGKLTSQGNIDLHQLTQAQALESILKFIKVSALKNYRVVTIVHGKGTRNQGYSVLKTLVNQVLPQIKIVLAFCSAMSKDGGTGATYVLLKT